MLLLSLYLLKPTVPVFLNVISYIASQTNVIKLDSLRHFKINEHYDNIKSKFFGRKINLKLFSNKLETIFRNKRNLPVLYMADEQA